MGDWVAYVVIGIPAPKGSLKCVGTKGHHRLIDTDQHTQEWRDAVVGRILTARQPGEAFDGPVVVDVTFTLPRPASVALKARAYPTKRSPGHGDIDKLARTVLDALEDAQVVADDSQVVELTARKVYPDSPHSADVLDEPGAVIRVIALDEP